MRFFLLFVFTFSFSPLTWAQYFDLDFNPSLVIKYRQDFMTSVKGHNNAIKAIVNEHVPFDNHLDLHIVSLERQFEQILSLFPVGSDFGKTNAKITIWEKPEQFIQAVEKAQQALQTFKKVAARGNKDEMRKAYKTFGTNSCGNCHKSFKKKQN
ncbi:MAG: cytochrome c [Gammaproteobacteria bacterium]|nr:cytochrome c [Gammaproteobacteria bacterium]